MPALMTAETTCTDEQPCPRFSPCSGCQARQILTSEDWYLISFYRLVAAQVDGMGGRPRLEGYRAALDLYGYPRSHHTWLAAGAQMLHGLMTKQDKVAWQRETGKHYGQIRPEDVS